MKMARKEWVRMLVGMPHNPAILNDLRLRQCIHLSRERLFQKVGNTLSLFLLSPVPHVLTRPRRPSSQRGLHTWMLALASTKRQSRAKVTQIDAEAVRLIPCDCPIMRTERRVSPMDPPPLTDGQLAALLNAWHEATLKGKAANLTSNVDRLIEYIDWFIRSRFRNYPGVDDLSQNFCIDFIEGRMASFFSREEPITAGRFRHWLYRAVRNRTSKPSKRAWSLINFDLPDPHPDAAPDPDHAAQDMKILQVVSEMDLSQREVVRLKFGEGLSNSEIAERLSIRNATTVRTQVLRALNEIRKELRRRKLLSSLTLERLFDSWGELKPRGAAKTRRAPADVNGAAQSGSDMTDGASSSDPLAPSNESR
jgi:RNA polymerase sigma factor (sigma-70 family)